MKTPKKSFDGPTGSGCRQYDVDDDDAGEDEGVKDKDVPVDAVQTPSFHGGVDEKQTRTTEPVRRVCLPSDDPRVLWRDALVVLAPSMALVVLALRWCF
jgi:hypothetical protein